MNSKLFQCNGVASILIENEIRDVFFINEEWIKIKAVILTVRNELYRMGNKGKLHTEISNTVSQIF